MIVVVSVLIAKQTTVDTCMDDTESDGNSIIVVKVEGCNN